MVWLVIFIAIFGLVLGVILGGIALFLKRKLGVLRGEQIYVDTESSPGESLQSKVIPLVGRPDYLIQENNQTIPVEVKTGRTPYSPYPGHKAQLMAYCYLVEEVYGIRPDYGYVKYPAREFRIHYNARERTRVEKLTLEILANKKSGKELHCNHPAHN